MKKPYATKSTNSLNTKKKNPSKFSSYKGMVDQMTGFKKNVGGIKGYKQTKERKGKY